MQSRDARAVVIEAPNIADFVVTAQTYCKLIARAESQEPREWLREVGEQLGRMQSVILQFEISALKYCYSVLSEFEERFEMYCRLKSFLGDYDGYWSDADLKAGDGIMSGSLADDLTDIYFEVKRGLDMCDEDPAALLAAVQLWRSGYTVHWRQHVVNAMRHIAHLKYL